MNQKTKGSSAPAILFALIAGGAYGVGGAFSQIAKSHGLEIGHLVVMQCVAALIILAVLAAVKFGFKMPRKQMVQLFFLGMSNVFSSIAYFLAIDLISVGAAVAIQFQYVWIAVVFQSIFDRKAPKPMMVVAAVLIVVGALMASGLAEEIVSGSFQMDPMGLVAGICCAISYALFIALNNRIATEYHPVTRSFYLIAGAVVLALIVLPFMGAGPLPSPGVFVPWGFFMGAIMIVIPTLCIVAASNKLPGGLVAILTSAELPVAVLAGCLMLGEGVTPISVAGVIIICAAIVLSESGSFFAKRRGSEAGDIAR
ncbi:MAG: EamA family transporter [Coriobacteriales bacterium]|jgi:drug/metabolite transporter (DMT)-like permease